MAIQDKKIVEIQHLKSFTEDMKRIKNIENRC